MNVLITGGGGFVGWHLVESQLNQHHRVRVIDLSVRSLSPLAGNQNLEVVPGDLTRLETIREAVEGIDIVYHLASAHLDVSLTDTAYRMVNVEATANLLDAASAAGVRRFVHCSTSGVFGRQAAPPAADEDSPCRPTHIYEISKLEGERAAQAFSRRTGFPVIVARPSWVYGPGCPRTRKLLRAAASRRFVMFGTGRTLRHPIYVADVVRGLERCGDADTAPGEIFILAGPSAVTIEELVLMAGEVQDVRPVIVHFPAVIGTCAGYALQVAYRPFRRSPPFSVRSMDFFLKHNLYDTSKSKRVLGFEAYVDLRDGLERTVAHAKSGGD